MYSYTCTTCQLHTLSAIGPFHLCRQCGTALIDTQWMRDRIFNCDAFMDVNWNGAIRQATDDAFKQLAANQSQYIFDGYNMVNQNSKPPNKPAWKEEMLYDFRPIPDGTELDTKQKL